MPGRYCFLCASDEGVFLSVTPANRDAVCEQLQACTLVKDPGEEDLLSQDLCHKCAYELKECYMFVRKVKESHKGRKQLQATSCFLCFESPPKGYVFDLNKDKSLIKEPLKKVKQIFDNDFDTWERKGSLICLTCRYTLDVLFDLKSIYQNTVNKLKYLLNHGIDYVTFPKTKTAVVCRRTTISETESNDVYVISDTDSSSSTMPRTRTQRGRVNNKKSVNSKPRICDGCFSSVKGGSDMYRYHKTGRTVCKNCWITMDPVITSTKRKTQKNSMATKLCTVFLKDVLTHSAFKKDKVYKVEEDNHGNKIYIITDESSEGESTLHSEYSTKKRAVSDTETVLRESRKRSTRNAKATSTDTEYNASSRRPDLRRTDESAKGAKHAAAKANVREKLNNSQAPTERGTKRSLRSRDNSIDSEADSRKKLKSQHLERIPESEQDLVLSTTLRKGRSRINPSYNRPTRPAVSRTRHKRPKSFLSDPDSGGRSDRKKLRNILKGFAVSKTDVSDESSSNDDNNARKRRKLSKTAAGNEKREKQPEASDPSSNKETLDSEKSQSTEPAEEQPSVAPASPKSKEPTPASRKAAFVCSECGVNYKNKLIGMAHQLTHFRQLEIKLERIPVDAAAAQRSASTEERASEQADDLSDGIFLTVEDDEDEMDVDQSAESAEKDSASRESGGGQPAEATDREAEAQSGGERSGVEGKGKSVDGEDDGDQNKENVSVPGESQREAEPVSKDEAVAKDASSTKEESSTKDESSTKEESSTKDESSTKEESSAKEESSRKEGSSAQDESPTKDDASAEGDEKSAGAEEPSEDERKEAESALKESLTEDAEKRQNGEAEGPSARSNPTDVGEEPDQMEDAGDKIPEPAPEREAANSIEKLAEYDEDVEEEEEDIEIRMDEKDTELLFADSQEKRNSTEDRADRAEPVADAADAGRAKEEESASREKEVECEAELKIVVSGSSESSVEQESADSRKKAAQSVNEDAQSGTEEVQRGAEDVRLEAEDSGEAGAKRSGAGTESAATPAANDAGANCADKPGEENSDAASEPVESDGAETRQPAEELRNEVQEKSAPDSGDAAAEVLQEVFDLATAEVHKREVAAEAGGEGDAEDEAETLENISREIQNSVDMPRFDCAAGRGTEDNDTPSQ